MMDLSQHIGSFKMLNVDKHASTVTINQFVHNQINVQSFIVSEVGGRLLIIITFKKLVNIDNITIFALAKPNLYEKDHVILQGFLVKQSRYINQARKRWMILKGRYLHSYKKSTDSKPTETFDLSEFNKIKVINNTQFELISKMSKKRLFTAESNNKLLNNFKCWTQSIQSVQNKCSNDYNHISAPKQIHIYKIKNTEIGLNQIESLKSDVSSICPIEKLESGYTINNKFNRTQSIAIYIESNQNNS
eukprot:447431_1